jgi:fructose-specific PTS system IIA-like component
VVVNPDEAVARYYQQEAWVRRRSVVSSRRGWIKTGTEDGLRLEVAANIAHSVEAAAAFNNGAQAVGLFRTEMLYMDRPGAPSEDELYNILPGAGTGERAQHYYSHHGYRRR